MFVCGMACAGNVCRVRRQKTEKPINYLRTYLLVVLIPRYGRRGITGYCGARELQQSPGDDVRAGLVAGHVQSRGRICRGKRRREEREQGKIQEINCFP